MASTVTCPHCSHENNSHRNENNTNYGSPLITCEKCGKQYLDTVREIALNGVSVFEKLPARPAGLVVLIAGFIFFCTTISHGFLKRTKNFALGVFLMAVGLFWIFTDIRSHQKRKTILEEERKASEARCSDPAYVETLKKLGYKIKAKK